jgi:hypothetical protein
MEYYSLIKKNEFVSFVVKQMELEIIMLRKISQTEKNNYHMFSHMWNTNLKI